MKTIFFLIATVLLQNTYAGQNTQNGERLTLHVSEQYQLAEQPYLERLEGFDNGENIIEPMPKALKGIGSGDLINIGKALWWLIEKGKPSSVWKNSAAHAIPKGAQSWQEFEYWASPKAHGYRFVLPNRLGGKPVTMDFKVVYTYNGSHNGKGKYLKDVTVHPINLNVSWGWNFEAKISATKPVNVGSKEDPIAGMKATLHWRAWTILNTVSGDFPFFVAGDGSFRRL